MKGAIEPELRLIPKVSQGNKTSATETQIKGEEEQKQHRKG